LTYFAPVC